MKTDKTKEQLINELAEMRRVNSEIEEKYRFLYEDSPAINMIIGTDGVIKDVNGILIRKYGFTKDDIIGKHALKFVVSDQRKKVAAQLRRDFKGEFTSEIEVDIYAKDRSIHTILFSAGNAILKEKGQLVGILVTGIDITERKQAEEALRKSEEKYRKLFDEAMDPIFVADVTTGIITDCNHVALELIGRKRSELVGKHQRILHPPEKIEGGFSKTFKQHLKEMKEQILEDQIITKMGEIKDVTIKASIFELEGKEVLLRIFRDVTERKLTDEALRKSEERFRFMAENTGDVLYRLKYDTMAFDYLSPAVSILTGYTAEKINKIGFKRLIKQMIIPGVPDVLTEELTKKRREGKTREWRAEYEILTKDGKTRWLGDHSFPWKDDSGKIVGSIGILQDITEHKRAEEELQERLQELEIYYKATIGREGRIIELKQQMNELLAQLGKEKKYDV